MNKGKSMFAQLMEFLPAYEFQKCVEKYRGKYKVKNFSCMDQFLTMAFAQLTYRESLRDTVICLDAAEEKLYHMGIRRKQFSLSIRRPSTYVFLSSRGQNSENTKGQ